MSVGLSPRQQASRRQLRREYLFPCRGYWSSQAKDMLPPQVITGDSTADSYNWNVSSQEGQLVRRRGIAYYGESDPTAQVGLLEAVSKNLSMNMVCRHMLDVQYPSATPGSVVGPTALFTDSVDTGHFGQIFGNTSTNGTRKVLGHEMGTLATPGTTHYTRTASINRPNFRMIPLPYMAGGSGTQATGYNRCTYPLLRALLCGGAMKMVQAGGYVFSPDFHATPLKWDGKSNPSTSTGSEAVHIGPWGHLPPLWCPRYFSATASAGTDDRIWWDGDQFYVSVVFQMEDGSFSAPAVVRARNATVTSGVGLVTVGSLSGSDSYQNVVYLIPVGPPGTKARVVCRTRKTNVSSFNGDRSAIGMTQKGATSDIDSGGRKLFVVAVVRDNYQINYTDTGSNDDASLRDDPIAINFATIWPLPARHAFEMERRIGIGYTRRQGPCAIILAPMGESSAADLNQREDAATGGGTGNIYGLQAWCFRLYQDSAGAMTLQLRRNLIGTGTIATQTIAITLATTRIQDILDTINATIASAGAAGFWAAQPAPGTDPEIFASNLAPTVLDVGSVSLGTTSVVTGTFTDVAIGMRVKVQSGTGTIPANSVVIGKTSDSSITIGDENGTAVNTTAGTATLRFWSETGDNSWSSDTATWDVGNVRCFSCTFPGIIGLKGSFLNGFSLDKQGMMFTAAPPGGSSLAPQSFLNAEGSRKSMPANAGIFMGAAPLYPNTIVCGSEGVYVLKNVKDTNTGSDQDYHLFPLSPRGRGCIQYGTITAGDGWAGYLTREGYIVTDGEQEVVISNALMDPARGTGILAYQSISLATTNGVADLPASQNAHAYVVDGTLRLSFGPNADISGQAGSSTQSALPTSAGAGGDWSNVGGAGSLQAALADSSDSTFARWTDDGLGTATALAGNFTAGLTNPGTTTGWSVKVTARSTTVASGKTMHFLLRSGVNVIRDFVLGFNGNTFSPVDLNVGSTMAEQTIPLTAADIAIMALYFGSQPFTFNISFSGVPQAGNVFEIAKLELVIANPPNSSMTDRGEKVTCVYDFSQNIEEFGLRQIVGPPGNWPWSPPHITNSGAMVRTWDGKLYAANDSNTGSTANGAIYELETGLLDTPVKVLAFTTGIATIIGSLVQSTGVITATTATDFRRVAVGAKITGSGITGSATVTAKSSNGNTITVSGTLTGNTTNASYTCWGREIEAQAYFAADRMDITSSDDISGQWITLAYACPTGEIVQVKHSFDMARATALTPIDLAATGAANAMTHRAPQLRKQVELPSRSRTAGPLQEYAVLAYNGSAGSDTSARSEVWGGNAMNRILTSYK